MKKIKTVTDYILLNCADDLHDNDTTCYSSASIMLRIKIWSLEGFQLSWRRNWQEGDKQLKDAFSSLSEKIHMLKRIKLTPVTKMTV